MSIAGEYITEYWKAWTPAHDKHSKEYDKGLPHSTVSWHLYPSTILISCKVSVNNKLHSVQFIDAFFWQISLPPSPESQDDFYKVLINIKSCPEDAGQYLSYLKVSRNI